MHKCDILDNGLTIVSETLSHTQTVAINLLVKFGSRFESPELSGISHFLEHMSFKGTKNRNAKQIAEEFELLGAHFNAYTGKESTVYTVFLLKEYVEKALDILADIVQNSAFDQVEVERERTVILQEIAQCLDSPDDVVFDNLQTVVFKDQPMGRTIIGTTEIIKNINSEALKKYVSNYYNASQMILAIAGNIEHSKVLDLVNKYFSLLKTGIPIKAPEAKYIGGYKYHKKDLEQVQIQMCFSGVSMLDEEYYVSLLLSGILGEGMSSRLFQEVREKRGLVYSIGTYNLTYSDIGTFNFYAGTDEKKANEVIEVIAEEFMKMEQEISDYELQKAKERIKTGVMASKELSSHRASELASDYAIFGKHITSKETLEKINKVNKKDIQHFCKKLYSSSIVSISSIGKIDEIIKYEKVIKLFN